MVPASWLALRHSVTYSLATSLFAVCRVCPKPFMRRLTARLLLIVLLVGVFVPVALAISAPPPHACCMRKPLLNHASQDPEFEATDCSRHDCCRPLAVSHWARPRPRVSVGIEHPSATLLLELRPVHRTANLDAFHSVRAPPPSSIT